MGKFAQTIRKKWNKRTFLEVIFLPANIQIENISMAKSRHEKQARISEIDRVYRVAQILNISISLHLMF